MSLPRPSSSQFHCCQILRSQLHRAVPLCLLWVCGEPGGILAGLQDVQLQRLAAVGGGTDIRRDGLHGSGSQQGEGGTEVLSHCATLSVTAPMRYVNVLAGIVHWDFVCFRVSYAVLWCQPL